MKIACPNCDTKYALNADALGTHGRKMKCAKCAHVWTARAPSTGETALINPLSAANQALDNTTSAIEGFPERAQSAPASDANKTVTAAETDASKSNDEDRWDEDLKEERAAEQVREASQILQPASGENSLSFSKESNTGKSAGLKQGLAGLKIAATSGLQNLNHCFKWARGLRFSHQMAVVIALIMPAILIFGLLAGRQAMVRQFPDLASLYAVVGVNVNLYGLEFEAVRTVRRPEDGIAVLIVEGHIRNITDSAKQIPRLHFILSGRYREVYAWQDDASPHPLPAGETIQFRTVLASPPTVADELHVRFLNNDPRLNRL